MPQLAVSTEGSLGVIVLDRPEAINALSHEMITGITDALEGWRSDDGIRAVLFEGRGPRGFCAGGDVRAVRDAVLAGRLAEADAYFAAEYHMNGLIAAYPKPVVALGHGAVMGGGIGILGHAAFSFATAEARFAMPEAAIGLVTDVGVNALLAMVPEPRALAFAMAGLPVGMGDALTLGLCDAAVAASRLEAVRASIVAAAGHTDPATALVQLMQAEGVEPGEATLCAEADGLATAFAGDTAWEIVHAVATQAEREPRFAPFAEALASRSPTSLEAILVSHRAARAAGGIDAVLRLDLRMAQYLIRQPDFVEGVRAVLVDKDRQPRWNPTDFAHVDRAALAAVVAEG